MAKFKYEMTNSYGKNKKGTMEASSIEAATAKLTAEGNVILSISEAMDLDSAAWNIQIGSGVKKKDITIFARQFASVLEAGVTVIEGLRMVQDQTENKALRKALFNVQTSVEKGETLAGAMKMEGKVFPDLLIHMVEAGEATGNMEIAFQRVAVQFEKDQKLHSLLVQSMIYPIMVLVVAAVVIVVLMMNVIPNFVEVFRDLDTELPTPTKIVMAVSDFFVGNPIVIFGIIGAVIALVILTKKTETGKQITSKLVLKIPAFRNFSVKSSAAKFATTMSTLIVAGVPLVECVGIVAGIIENRVIRKSLEDAKADVLEGIPLSEPLENSGIFPPMLSHMVKIGEETGTVETMLDKVADYYEEETENATKALTAIMEPVTIILLAVVVGGVVMAIVMPMMGIYQAAGS